MHEEVKWVPVLHCPKCGSRLDIRKESHIWTVTCSGCKAQLSIDGTSKDLFDAYDEFSTAIKRGTLASDSSSMSDSRRRELIGSGADTKRRRRRASIEGRVQSEEKIEKIVADGGYNIDEMPAALQDLILNGRDYLVKYQYMPATEADYGANLAEMGIPSRLVKMLKRKDITQLYEFQETAFNEIMNGENVVIAAPTAQGKTEAFILPIIRKLLLSVQDAFMNPGVRALLC